jgi:hypothetical protein
MRSTTFFLLSITLLSWSVSARNYAENITIYRWVDENNVVHFSQNQPEHDNYQELTMTNADPVRTNQSTEIELKGKQQDIVVSLSEQCQTAKANLITLTSFDKVQYIDQNGETKILSADEKTRQIALNKKQIAIYCGQEADN